MKPPSADDRIPAVVYAARSLAEEPGKDSTGDQVGRVHERLEREPGRFVYGEPHTDHASGFKGNRGPGLEDAIVDAERAVAEHAQAELWVWATSRLGRGTGRPGEARAIGHLLYELRAKGVTVRAVEDDTFATNEMLWGFASQMASKYSEDLGANVSRGMRAAADRGRPPGGICPDGYLVLREVDEHGRKTHRWEKDPERWEIYSLHFDLALAGHSDREIVLELDRRGYRTRPKKVGHRSRSFDANRVRQTLTNPIYAGLRTYKGDIVGKGNWPAVVSPEDFERIRAMRAHRSHGRKPTTGRPPEGYVLARVANCGACGGPMDVVTGRHVRKDGTRPRRYVCRAHRERPQDCSAKPVDAGLVDGAFVSNLTHFLGDVDAWRGALVTSREAERARLENEVERARADIAATEKVLGAARRRYDAALAAGDDERADTIEEAMRGQRVERSHAESRLSAALAAMNDAGEDVGIDPLLDFYNGLSAELSGRVVEARGDVKRLNVTVQSYFERVVLTGRPDGVEILPVLSAAAASRILADVTLWPHVKDVSIHGVPLEAAINEEGDGVLRRDNPSVEELERILHPPDVVEMALTIAAPPPLKAITAAPDINAPTASTSCCATCGATWRPGERARWTLTRAGCARS